MEADKFSDGHESTESSKNRLFRLLSTFTTTKEKPSNSVELHISCTRSLLGFFYLTELVFIAYTSVSSFGKSRD